MTFTDEEKDKYIKDLNHVWKRIETAYYSDIDRNELIPRDAVIDGCCSTYNENSKLDNESKQKFLKWIKDSIGTDTFTVFMKEAFHKKFY